MAYTTINKSSLHQNTVLYTGNNTAIGSGGNSVTGVGFQPDMTWIKARNSTDNHNIYDVVRGSQKRVIPNDTAAEDSSIEFLNAWTSDGFNLGNGGNVNDNYNYNSNSNIRNYGSNNNNNANANVALP